MPPYANAKKAYGTKSKKSMSKRSKKTSFAKKVMSVVSRTEETKYVAEYNGTVALAVGDTISVPGDLDPVLPILAQGTQSNERVGQKISNCKGKIDFTFYFDNEPESRDVFVRVFFLKSRQAKSFPVTASLSPGTLLDAGIGNTTDWVLSLYSARQLEQMPLNKESFTGKSRLVHLRKNAGTPNGSLLATQTLTQGQIAGRCSFSWKMPMLMYDTATSSFPSNFNPVFAYVAYNADNTVYTGQIVAEVRQHMWFKDS